MNRTVDTQNDVLIEYIECPKLTSVEFSSNLQGAFDNINDNFARLANHEFIKGDMGTSVFLDQVSIYDNENLSEIGFQLKKYLQSILGNQYETITANEIQLNYFDNFTPSTAGKIQMIYNKNSDSIDADIEPVSSLQYVFLDGRFWNDKIGNVDAKYLDGITDLSSIIVYDSTVEGGFKSLNDAFPTMYYEEGVGLCWKINGKPTGMPVQGIPGKDGKNSLMRIVKVNSLIPSEGLDKSTGEVSYIFETLSGYIPVTNEDIDINDYSDSSALIIEGSGKIYIGMLSIAKKDITNEETGEVSAIDVLIATCDPNTSLNDVLSSQEIHDAFKKININGSLSDPKVLQGLFIPIKDEKDGVQPVHLISASSIINTSDTSSVDATKNDVVFTPIKNIDDLNPTEENPLNIEKYLYVKLDKEYNKVMSSLDANKKRIGDSLSAYNYCIKYKLIHIAKDKNDEYLKPSDDFTNKNKYNFGYTINSDGTETLLTKDNVLYKTKETASTDYKETLPNDLDLHPLYVWERQIDRADYDIDEMVGAADYSDVPVQFNYICTKTFTPGISSDIYWFNVLDIVDESNDKYIVRGWSNSDFDMFKIIKFVPVFKDENYHVYDDTAVNFNYNLNITGCDHEGGDSRRNLTVHGDVNCDNINVYRLTATGEIDNIYTKQNIVGDSGIMLAKDQEGKYMFEIDSDGNISGKTLDVSGQINASTVISNGLIASGDVNGNAGMIQTNNLQLVDKNESKEYISFDASNGVSNINVLNTDKIKIEKHSKLSDDQKYLSETEINGVSKIITNTPIVACNNSSINVSDLSIDNSNSVFVDENISKELYDHFSDKANQGGAIGEYYDNITKGLKDAPNSYAVAKEVLTYKLNNTLDSTDTSFSSEPNYVKYSFDNHSNGIYYYNPPKSTSQRIKFRATSTDATKTIESDGYACKFVIKHNDSYKFNPNVPIVITPAKMSFNMGLYTHCDNGTWTYFENSSWLKFRTIVTDESGSVLYDNVSSEEYKFNNGNTQWGGGNTESGAAVAGNNYESWRFKTFEVNPYKILISDSNALKSIANTYNKNSDITICVYPEFNINISWKNTNHPNRDRKVADDCKILKFVSVGSSSSNKTISEKAFAVRKGNLQSDTFSKITYNLFVNTFSDENNNTVLCKDGLLVSSVVKSSDNINKDGYLFGIGLGRNYTDNSSWIARPEICYGKLISGEVEMNTLSFEDFFEKLNQLNN